MTFLGFLLWFSASFGMQEYSELYQYRVYEHPEFSMEFEVHAESDWLDVYFIWYNEMDRMTGTSFMPKVDYFTTGAKVNFGPFRFTAEHMCQHPVATAGYQLAGEYGYYNRITVGICSTDWK